MTVEWLATVRDSPGLDDVLAYVEPQLEPGELRAITDRESGVRAEDPPASGDRWPSNRPPTSYHALSGDSGEILILVRLNAPDSPSGWDVYQPGVGWISDDRAFDVMRNGQDYDLLTASEARAMITRWESESDPD